MAVFNQAQVDEFVALAGELTGQAGTYAGQPFSDVGQNGFLSQLQVSTSSLQVALAQTAQRAAQRSFPAPPPEAQEEPEVDPEPPATTTVRVSARRR